MSAVLWTRVSSTKHATYAAADIARGRCLAKSAFGLDPHKKVRVKRRPDGTFDVIMWYGHVDSPRYSAQIEIDADGMITRKRLGGV